MIFSLAVLSTVSVAGSAVGGERITGPVAARVIAVVDGDTLLIRARIWLGQEVETRVRLEAVDAPEMRARCLEERRLAEAARDLLEREIGGREVVLRDVEYGKYAGRVIARIETLDGRDLARLLVERGLARPYDGGRRQGWCREAAKTPAAAAQQPDDGNP